LRGPVHVEGFPSNRPEKHPGVVLGAPPCRDSCRVRGAPGRLLRVLRRAQPAGARSPGGGFRPPCEGLRAVPRRCSSCGHHSGIVPKTQCVRGFCERRHCQLAANDDAASIPRNLPQCGDRRAGDIALQLCEAEVRGVGLSERSLCHFCHNKKKSTVTG